MYKEYYNSPNRLRVVGRGWFCNLYCTLPPTSTPPLLLIVPSPLPLCPGSYKSPPAVVHFSKPSYYLAICFPPQHIFFTGLHNAVAC